MSIDVGSERGDLSEHLRVLGRCHGIHVDESDHFLRGIAFIWVHLEYRKTTRRERMPTHHYPFYGSGSKYGDPG